jgi:hypothetical protein
VTRPESLPPPAELAAKNGHGRRVTYVSGCRCEECRAANADYERERAGARASGDWNGLVPAAETRHAIVAWLRDGGSQRELAEAADVARSLISLIAAGKRRRIRARTARRILEACP